MTLFRPSLFVREVAIYRGSTSAYRGSFKIGVNIITGENSSGKSSILNLIAYGLGADINKLSEHAKLCDRVFVEVLINGSLVTLSRLISANAGQPMEIYLGPLADAERASSLDWRRYPYRSSASRESFSQALFQLLGLPELETETSGKITIHQVLRLLYSDQLSSVEHIFRDDNFDSPYLREAVGRLLFGAYEAEIYKNQLRIRQLEKEWTIAESSLRSIYTILSGLENSLTLDWVDQERRKIIADMEEAERRILDLENSSSTKEDSISFSPQENALSELQRVQASLIEANRSIESLRMEIADSDLFILTLKRKIEALQNSSIVAANVKQVSYSICPSCLTPVKDSDDLHVCSLCKAPRHEERLRQGIVRQLNDMSLQVKQSEILQEDRTRELARLSEARENWAAKWEVARRNFERVRTIPTSKLRDQIRQQNERIGFLKRELQSLEEKSVLIGRLDEMSKKKAAVSAELDQLGSVNERLKALEQERLSRAYTSVAEETISFLHNDLPRQDSFQQAQTVNFNFHTNTMGVDGQSNFSASSTVYLKNAFLSGLLFAATEDPQFRHPRFLMLDTIEDKGMEIERSQNFQNLLVARSEVAKSDHQIIFATAMISPSLDNEKYVVGRRSTHTDRTLRILT